MSSYAENIQDRTPKGKHSTLRPSLGTPSWPAWSRRISDFIAGARPSWPWAGGLSLQRKLTLIVAVVSLIAIMVGGVSLKAIIDPAFRSIEATLVEDQERRAAYVFEDLALQMRRNSKDYATWDDTYEFIIQKTPDYVESNISPTSLESLGMDAIVFVNLAGQVELSLSTDSEHNEDKVRNSQILQALNSADFYAMALREPSFSSFIATPEGTFAVGASRITRSDGSGEPRGLVVMVRFITAELVGSALRVPVTLTNRSQAEVSSDVVRSSVAVQDARKRPVAYVSFNTPRTVKNSGDDLFRLAAAIGLLVLVASLTALTFSVRRLAVRRILALETHLRRLQATNSLEPVEDGLGNDELNRLVRGFNDLILQLRDARQLLMIQSYDQGKSDWSAGALHNMRNSLNPLVVLFGLWRHADKPQWRDRVRLAAGELSAGTADAARAGALTAFLIESARLQAEQMDKQSEQMSTAQDCLQQVLSILSEQHAPAHQGVRLEPVALGPLLDSAAAVATHSPLGEIQVLMPATDLFVSANEILLSQVLVNLFTNASESIHGHPGSEKRIEVALERRNAQGPGTVVISIRDFGGGIDLAMLPHLFERGFSTRKEKVGGLGLHWVANSINSMGGEIEIVSDGPGRGATARLSLSLARADFGRSETLQGVAA